MPRLFGVGPSEAVPLELINAALAYKAALALAEPTLDRKRAQRARMKAKEQQMRGG